MRRDVNEERVLEQNRRFHDEVESESYDRRMGACFDDGAVREMMDELERVLGGPLPRGGLALDLGAGTGNVAIKIARSGRFERVVAVDISTGMLKRAAENAAAAGVEIETVESDLQRLPFADASVDFVAGCAVLHHLPDPPVLMREVARVLRPGAPMAFIGEPSAWGARFARALKQPALLANRAIKLVTGRSTPREEVWKHELIDVHTFGPRDIAALTEPFTDVRVVTEGFLRPAVEEGMLVPLRYVFGRLPPVERACSRIGKALGRLDRASFDRWVPAHLRASVKLSGRRR